MSIIALALSTALATASHPVTVDHKGATVQAVYDARVATRMKTVGVATGARMSSQSCRWQANVTVDRRLTAAGGGELVKTVATDKRISGQRPGSCRQIGSSIEADIAARSDEVRDHVRQVAERDRPALLADVDAARALAMN